MVEEDQKEASEENHDRSEVPDMEGKEPGFDSGSERCAKDQEKALFEAEKGGIDESGTRKDRRTARLDKNRDHESNQDATGFCFKEKVKQRPELLGDRAA